MAAPGSRHHGCPAPRHARDEREADALVAFAPGQVCAVLTADCLPVLFCDRPGSRIAVAHAGWRGLAAGVLQATVNALESDPADLMAWLGPAIGPAVYEVGEEVAAAFPDEFTQAFAPRGDRWLLDLYAVARLKLASVGVNAVFGGGLCTYSDPERFFLVPPRRRNRPDGDPGMDGGTVGPNLFGRSLGPSEEVPGTPMQDRSSETDHLSARDRLPSRLS